MKSCGRLQVYIGRSLSGVLFGWFDRRLICRDWVFDLEDEISLMNVSDFTSRGQNELTSLVSLIFIIIFYHSLILIIRKKQLEQVKGSFINYSLILIIKTNLLNK